MCSIRRLPMPPLDSFLHEKIRGSGPLLYPHVTHRLWHTGATSQRTRSMRRINDVHCRILMRMKGFLRFSWVLSLSHFASCSADERHLARRCAGQALWLHPDR
jgi:hypothetical protein